MKKTLLKTRQDAAEFLVWAVGLQMGIVGKETGQLQTERGHCCLGFGCELFAKTPRLHNGLLHGGLPLNWDGIPKWFELVDEDFKNKTGRRLSELNDGYVSRTNTFEKERSHKWIGKKLIEVYAEELNNIYEAK